jgi:mRNA interferase HigB
MRVIAKRTLREFWESTPKYSDAEDPLKSWYREAKQAIWLTPANVKEQYRNASILKNNRTVFNIAGNKYRALLILGMICPHPARSFGSGSPLPSLGEGLGVRAKSMLHTRIQQRQISLSCRD